MIVKDENDEVKCINDYSNIIYMLKMMKVVMFNNIWLWKRWWIVIVMGRKYSDEREIYIYIWWWKWWCL